MKKKTLVSEKLILPQVPLSLSIYEKKLTLLPIIKINAEVAFSNGCRAPPWKQVLGDICYIKVVPCDGAEFYITASTEGYYVNKVQLALCQCYMYFN